MKTINAIIVDDEELGRSLIREYLVDYPQIKIVAECRDAYEALTAITEWKPDLVFLDIQMPEINGFELLEMLEERPQIIFSTAYDRYAVKAFEVNAIDYLLKPYDAERFNIAVARAIKNIDDRKNIESKIDTLLKTIRPPQKFLERLLIKQSGRIHIISCHEIYWIEAMSDYANIHTRNDAFLIQQSLNHLETLLDPDRFIRVHRSFMVNFDAVKDMIAWFGGRYKLSLKDGKEIVTSRAGFSRLKRFIV